MQEPVVDPIQSWVSSHWETLLSALGGALGGAWLGLRKFLRLEARVEALEKQQAESQGDIREIKKLLQEQSERTSQFWREEWPVVVSSATRLDGIERVCIRLENQLLELVKKT